MRLNRRQVCAVLALLVPALAPPLPPVVRADTPLPIFDAHIHYNLPAWQIFDPPYVKSILDQAGIVGALVSSTPDEGSLKLYNADPARFVPQYRPYRGRVLAPNWTRDPALFETMATGLSKADYAGIGELHIYRMRDVDWEVVARVAAIARERGLFLHVHAESPSIKRIFELEPDIEILWAHAGFYDGPEVIGAMLDKYDRLTAELSLRAPNIMAPIADDIDPAWKDVLVRHADRFVVGTDTYMNISWTEYDTLVGDHRRWLEKLPRDAAEKIAYRNAVKLYGKNAHD